MRLLKTVHGWLGVFVLPWVIIIGLTGLYLNHERLVMGLLEGEGYDEAQFDAWPDPQPMTAAAAPGNDRRLGTARDCPTWSRMSSKHSGQLGAAQLGCWRGVGGSEASDGREQEDSKQG